MIDPLLDDAARARKSWMSWKAHARLFGYVMRLSYDDPVHALTHCVLPTARYTLRATRCVLHTCSHAATHCALHTARYTPRATHRAHAATHRAHAATHCALHTARYTPRATHRVLHTCSHAATRCALHAARYTLCARCYTLCRTPCALHIVRTLLHVCNNPARRLSSICSRDATTRRRRSPSPTGGPYDGLSAARCVSRSATIHTFVRPIILQVWTCRVAV